MDMVLLPPLMVTAMNSEHARQVEGWQYDGLWSRYDQTHPLPENEIARYWSVTANSGELVGFYCTGEAARVLGLLADSAVIDLGVGLRPDLVGQGNGLTFATAVLRHIREMSDAERARAVVQEWNERSRRLAVSLGFVDSGSHVCEQDGRDVTYRVLILEMSSS